MATYLVAMFTIKFLSLYMETVKLTLSYRADLETIIKYHSPSSLYLDNDQSKMRAFTIELIVRGNYDKERDMFLPTADYNYEHISKDLGISELHLANMLVVTWNILMLEWNPHNDFVEKENIEDRDKLFACYYRLLKELLILKCYNAELSQIKIKTEEGILKVESEMERKSIIDMLIENRISDLKADSYKLLFNADDIENWSIDTLREVINLLKRSPAGDRATWLIGRYVSNTLLNYLKGERLLLKNESMKISQNQGVLIYTILLAFNLIKKTEAVKTRDNEGKAKYVYSLIDERKNLKKQEIRKTEWVEYPLK